MVEDVARLFNAEISYFEWVDDFSKARNFNFSQVPKDYEYIMWADADDGFRGMEKLRDIMKKYPADVYSMFYSYAFDNYKNPIVVHQKTMIVKNDGCVEWVAPVHEDFKENRNTTRYLIKDIDRIHLTNDDRITDSRIRNLKIAKNELEKTPNDPRTYWNLAKAYSSDSQWKNAIDAYNKFMSLSSSDSEKYIAKLSLSGCYYHDGQMSRAMDEARYAIGLKPEYPDAYFYLARYYHQLRNLHESANYYLTGLQKKPPYYEIVVYNPRDYDYVPMKELAVVYYEMARGDLALPLLEGCLKIYPKDKTLKSIVKLMKKEAKKTELALENIVKLSQIKNDKKLKEELDNLPDDIKYHPHILMLRNSRFIKKESSGKDIAIFCGYTAEEWTPETAKIKGIGGSEEAIIHLAERWANNGWNVEVYNNCGHTEKRFGKVLYKPFQSFNTRDKQDITILWRTPQLADKIENSGKIFIDLHDVIPSGEFTEERLKHIDKIFVKSEFHQSLFPNVPSEKFVILPNGIDSKVFEQEVIRDNKLLINTSSPDRSLSAVIELFGRIKKEVPDAKMKWAYGWGVFDSAHSSNENIMNWKSEQIKKMQEYGIENLGRLSHSEVAQLYMQANVFLYPTEFAEIHCISAAKAQAGGAIPVTTDFSALNETVQYGHKIKSNKTKDNWYENNQFDFSVKDEKQKDEIVKRAVEVLKNPPQEKEREEMRNWARETFNWDKIANNWQKEF
jgi:glycosyltransferase involved in cell wall biosynthesis